MIVAAVIAFLVAVVAFGVWALIRSAADADRQIYKMMEAEKEEQDDGKTEREN